MNCVLLQQASIDSGAPFSWPRCQKCRDGAPLREREQAPRLCLPLVVGLYACMECAELD